VWAEPTVLKHLNCQIYSVGGFDGTISEAKTGGRVIFPAPRFRRSVRTVKTKWCQGHEVRRLVRRLPLTPF